jgi:hypothetical protein
MKLAYAALAAVLLAGCQQGTNTNGTPTTPAEQVAASGLSAYIVADRVWLSYLRTHQPPDKAVVASIEPRRKAARAALTAYTDAAVRGETVDQAAVQGALAAFQTALANQGIK